MLQLRDELETHLWEITEAKREKAWLQAEKEKVERDTEIIWEAEQLHVALDHEDKEKCVHQRELLRQEAGCAPPASTSRAAITDVVHLDNEVIILEKADRKYTNGHGAHNCEECQISKMVCTWVKWHIEGSCNMQCDNCAENPTKTGCQ
jgi:hypothetical protein